MQTVIIPLAGIMSSISNDGCWHDLGPDGSLEQLAGMDILEHFGGDVITTPERAPYVLQHLIDELDYRIGEGWVASEVNNGHRPEEAGVWQHNADHAFNYMAGAYGEGCTECSAWIEYEPDNKDEALEKIDGEEFVQKMIMSSTRINLGHAPIYFLFEQCDDCRSQASEVIKARKVWTGLAS